MAEDRHVRKWLAEGLITEAQAQRMLADVAADRAERSSDKLIVAVSTIGAALLGIGAILFVASNWQTLSRLAKVAILMGSTFGTSALGYALAYERRSLPKVGAALLFLGSVLFGATIFLIGQIYHVQAHNHLLVLLWLVGVVPLVYILESSVIAGLASLLLLIWVSLFVFRGMEFDNVDWPRLPAIYLVAGVLFFELGGLHYLASRWKGVARVYRLGALKVVMCALFLLTFEVFSGEPAGGWWGYDAIGWTRVKVGIYAVGFLAAAAAAVNTLLNPSKSETPLMEGAISAGLAALTLLCIFLPAQGGAFPFAFNLAMAGCVAALMATGYRREDILLVNIGMWWLAALVVARYYDWFWSLLSRSVFFLIGGAILVVGGMVLERKRRELKMRFAR